MCCGSWDCKASDTTERLNCLKKNVFCLQNVLKAVKYKNSFLKSFHLKTVYLPVMCSENTLNLETEDLGSDPMSATSCIMLQKRWYLSEGNSTHSHDMGL